ncbi:PGF-pre-PGF domain-containing protein [Halobellus sp. Atlit-38R]|uniref:PGF-pre-PGF domain-containing protein n=1 Tax=Halobellus sp. Atlit-38R TaxID=2282131 RepID=UPI000EF22F9A|nr:PGF-pre-PGF domain-containing protein [Halobellus sp. Atlit-38R]RLM88325.1 PGF-pre-PGF domain-containing protein [Halobellus sp. Atlit-38R]
MTFDSWRRDGGRRLLAVALALVVVASVSGSATTALLSDRESIDVGLTVDDHGGVSQFHVESVAACPVETVEHEAATLQLTERFDVEGDGCAQISVWVSESWLDRVGTDVDDVVIGHENASGWAYFETTVVREQAGWYELTAVTDGFSPFGLFVPNETFVDTAAGAAATGASGPDEAAAPGVPGDRGDLNVSDDVTGSDPANETVGEVAADPVEDETAGNATAGGGIVGNATQSGNGANDESGGPDAAPESGVNATTDASTSEAGATVEEPEPSGDGDAVASDSPDESPSEPNDTETDADGSGDDTADTDGASGDGDARGETQSEDAAATSSDGNDETESDAGIEQSSDGDPGADESTEAPVGGSASENPDGSEPGDELESASDTATGESSSGDDEKAENEDSESASNSSDTGDAASGADSGTGAE